MPSNEAQQQYGFVNFESLPIEPEPLKQPAESMNPVSPDSDIQMTSASEEKNTPPAQQQTDGTEQQPRGNGHAVMYPQKQRPARTQIDERDYSVYHVDSAQQPDQQSSSSNDTDQMDDTDIRIQKKLSTPPGKQQKGFLSKFFNREEQ